MSDPARRRWALLILTVGLPAYIVVAVNVVALFERPPVWAELGVFVTLGIAWALPLRAMFRGVGKADPTAPTAPTAADADGGRRDEAC
jgi:hypothetical protein